MKVLVAPVLAVLTAVGLGLLLRSQDPRSEPEPFERLNLTTHDPSGAVNRLARVLSFPTVSSLEAPNHVPDPEVFRQQLEFIQAAYPLVFQHITTERVNEYSLLLTWAGQDPTLRPLLLMSHSDVVPAPDGVAGSNWTYPPFSGTVADGYIWGRGALDIKVGLVSILEAVEELLRVSFVPRRTVLLAFGHDEEVGGAYGAGAITSLLQSRGVTELELVVDEGGIIISDGVSAGGYNLVPGPVALVGTAEKGFEMWEIEVEGKGAHSSMPPSGGTSVAARLARILASLESNPPPTRLVPPVGEWLTAMGAGAKLAPLRMLLGGANSRVLGPLLAQLLPLAGDDIAAQVRTTCAVVGVKAGGIADNVLPTSGTIKLNFRTLPGDGADFIREYLQTMTHREKQHVKIRALHPDQFKASPVTPTHSPHFQLLREAILQTLAPPQGMVVAPYLLTGMTDSRYYGTSSSLATGRVFRFSPHSYNRGAGDIGRVHGTDERVSVDDYLRGIGFYMRLVQLASSDMSYEEGGGGNGGGGAAASTAAPAA